MHKDTLKYLTFITPDELYEWMRLPFGIAGAPAVQQRMMGILLAGVKWISALAYLDDTVIYSKTFGEHPCQLEFPVKRCDKGTLRFNPARSTVCKQETTYIGFAVFAGGSKLDSTNRAYVQVSRTERPQGGTQVLGVGSYCRRFMQNYARSTEFPQRPIPQETEFVWGLEQQQAFDDNKQATTSATLTRHLTPLNRSLLTVNHQQ